MNMQERMKRKTMIITTMIALISTLLVSCASKTSTVQTTQGPNLTPTPIYPSGVPPSAVLGITAGGINSFNSIPWVRVSYATCVRSGPSGAGLKATVAKFHGLGVRVMLTVCQWAKDARLYDTKLLNDAAQAGADAVQCGNEQMKTGPYNLGV